MSTKIILRHIRSLQAKTCTPCSLLRRNPWMSPLFNAPDVRYFESVIPSGTLDQKTWTRTPLVFDLSVKRKLEFVDLTSYYESDELDSDSIDSPVKQQILSHGLEAGGPWEVLGTGGFGTVFKASYHGQPVAAKLLCLSKTSRSVFSLQRERNALGLDHPHVVCTLAVLQGPRYGLVVMERVTKHSLQTLISNKAITSYQQRLRYLKELCEALQYCHSHGILHLDVKPLNLLLDYYGVCKLSDFGNSAVINGFGKFGTTLGTVCYSAPEILKGKEASFKSDIFSVGVTMWHVLAGKTPYRSKYEDDHTILYKVVKFGMRPEPANLPSPTHTEDAAVHDGYVSLYQSCWHGEPILRPTIEEVLTSLKNLASLAHHSSQV